MEDFEKFPYKLTNEIKLTNLKVGEIFTPRDQIQRMFRIILFIEG